MKKTLGLVILLACADASLIAQVVLNEFQANPSHRILKWDASGVPTVGSGRVWYDTSFQDATWQRGYQPFGQSVAGLGTDLSAPMQGRAYSLYLRKAFAVSLAQATSTRSLKLSVEYDDGFVAYLNGVEIARKNLGPERHFIHALQRSYNATSGHGAVEIDLGPCSQYLVEGENLLAIQVHNFELGGDLKMNASLGTFGDPERLLVADLDFDDGSGASRTFTVVDGGTPVISTSGTAQNWLTQVSDPEVAGTWDTVEIVTTEVAGGGSGDSGYLRYDLSQLGSSGVSASMFGPSVDLQAGWLAENITPQMLADTWVSFRYKVSPGSLFSLQMLPQEGQELSAIKDAPWIGAATASEHPFYTFNGPGGSITYTTDSLGEGHAVYAGNRWYHYSLWASENLASGEWKLMENPGEPSPDGGAPGVMRYELIRMPTKLDPGGDEWFGVNLRKLRLEFWPRGRVSANDLARTRIRFRYRASPGIKFNLRLEPDGGGYSERLDLGRLTGSGAWLVYDGHLGSWGNSDAWLAHLNAGAASATDEDYGGYLGGKIVIGFSGLDGMVEGNGVELDDVVLWYDTALPEELVSRRDYSTASGGQETCTIDDVGTEMAVESGSLVHSYQFYTASDLRNGQMVVAEDAGIVSPEASSGYGVLKFTWSSAASVTPGGDDWWYWKTRDFKSPGWPAQAVTAAVLERSRVSFWMKAPSGKPISMRIELSGNGYDERLDFGAITGTGNWEKYQLPCASADNGSAFLAAINQEAGRVDDLRIIFGNAAPISTYETGDVWLFDDLSMVYAKRDPVGTRLVRTFHGSPGAGMTHTIDGVGTGSTTGGLSGMNAWFSCSAALRDGAFSLGEDASEADGSGDGNGPGFLRLVTTTVPTTVTPGDHWWAVYTSPYSVPEWHLGRVTHYDLARTRLKMRVRIPAGRSLSLRIDPAGGVDPTGSVRACDMGVLTGNGNWQTYQRTLDQGQNLDAFLEAVNANAPVGQLNLVVANSGAPSQYLSGDTFDFDNIELIYEGYADGDSDHLSFEDAAGGMRHHRRLDGATSLTSYLGDFTAGSRVVANVSSLAGIQIGMRPSSEHVPQGATITAIDAASRSLTLSEQATGSAQQVAMVFGAVRRYAYAYSDPAATGFSMTVKEDNTPGAGYRGSGGHLRVDYHSNIATGEYMGVAINGIDFGNLRAGEVTADQLDAMNLEFALKVPVGMPWFFWLEPEGGGYEQRLDLIEVIGTGEWQEVSIPLIDRNDTRSSFMSQLNQDGANQCRLAFSGSPQQPPGAVLQIDDIRVSSWREYRVNLASLGNTSAFIDDLNGQSLTTLMPVFSMESTPAMGGSSLCIDDFRIEYVGAPSASIESILANGADGGVWNYFVGHHEPSGIVVDTKLVTDPFPPPAGKEEDYEDPHEARDWLELRNGSGSAYDLSGHSLTDDDGKPQKWMFPDGTVVPANGYLLVFCDNRFEANGATADYLHSNFGLSSEGGVISLYEGPTLLDTVVYPGGQTPHESYGRDAAGSSWVFLQEATPLAANQGGECIDKCRKPNTFTADGVTPIYGGFYDSPQTVVLSTSTPAAIIRYTLDGSDPVANSTLYTGPLTISAIDDKTGTVLRARAFKSGYVPSKITTRTFLIGQHAAIKTLPALVMTGDSQRVWYESTGILSIVGGVYDADGIWSADGPESYNIACLDGSAAERPAYLEYLHPNGVTEGFFLNAGVRLSTSDWTAVRARYDRPHDSPWNPWEFEQKPSFNLFFRGVYGKSKLEYPLLPGYDVARFDHLRLRAGKNDIANPHITDELCRRIFAAMGNEGATGNWCSLYVNGSFKGYYNLCERVRESFFQSHYASNAAWDVIYNGDAENGTREAFDALLFTDLERDLTVPENYEIVKSKLDINNACDYYLMKIYTAMWDWPGNNWVIARERSMGPNSIFRFADWDSEGGFNAIGYTGHDVDYDTIGRDLKNNYTEVGRIFNRLRRSPEFRLAFADRIQKHFFNGGVLDDRASVHPEFWLKSTKDELKGLVSPIMQYVIGESFDESWFHAWTNESSGRRSHLFGNGDASFITHGFWPTAQAATLGLAGGNVSYGSSLTISAGSGTIYYTIDGSDPRLTGGGVNPEAYVYSGPIALVVSGTVKVRVMDGGEWSPLSEASYVIDPVEPAVGNLVIAELMYHGAPPTAAELLQGYDTDSFDYCRVMNIGDNPVLTAGLSFYGVDCVLPKTGGNVPYLEPGQSFLIVRDINAFRFRYGSHYDHMIAASYTSNFSNGGELVALIYTPPEGGASVDVVSFTYSDDPPWPKAPDRYGPSLLLADPLSDPDPDVPSNWMVSCGMGGQPGGEPFVTDWETWAGLAFSVYDPEDAKHPEADPDGDGLVNLLEYVLGTSPRLVNQPAGLLPEVVFVADEGQSFLGLECRVNSGASEAVISVESSSDLGLESWHAGIGHTVETGAPTHWLDGSHSFIVRDALPTTANSRRFMRMKVSLP